LKDLNHPNIPKVYGFYANDDFNKAYLIMEFCDGFMDLNDYVKENGPLEDDQVMQVVYLTAHSIAYLHKLKIAHRDIKPQNLLIKIQDGIVES
jgi:serine/threonine protein kinase